MNDIPPYLEAVRQRAGKALSWLDVERQILKAWKPEHSQDLAKFYRSNPHLEHRETVAFPEPLEPVTLEGWSLHFYHFLRQLIPSTVITPELLRMIQAIEQTRLIEERKIVNFIGHKNGAKTEFFSLIALALTAIDAEFTRAYISGPYIDAAHAVVWGRLGTRWNQMLAANRKCEWLQFCRPEKGDDRYTIYPGLTEAGFIELLTLDKVGKLQGVKSMNPDKGWIILICDEINQFQNRAFLELLENLKGNRNLLVITGCNFKSLEGMDGDLCRPEGREFSELGIETDFDWLSAYSSHTWRFDGHRCSNILAGRTIYRFLLDEKTRAESERDHGLNGPKYLEQIRSHPNSSMSDYFVLTREKIRAYGGMDDTQGYWEGVTPRRCAFMDPGWGGDPARLGVFRFGQARVPTTEGDWITASIFEPLMPFETIMLNGGQKCDDAWLARLLRVSGGHMLTRVGEDVSLDDQLAVAAAEFCIAHDVDYHAFGFDGSMRSGIVHSVCSIMGTKVQPIDPVGGPTDRELPFQPERKAKDEYFNFVSEEYFNFASLVQARQFRGGDRVPAAIAQICRRPWKWSGTKKQIQTKEKYKADNQGRSPDDADVLVGGFEMALRLGFIAVHSRRPDAASYAIDPASLMEHLSSNKRFRRYGAPKLTA